MLRRSSRITNFIHHPLFADLASDCSTIGLPQDLDPGQLHFHPGLLGCPFANNFYTGLIGTLLVAPGLGGSMIMPFPIISEVIDDDADRHGFRREGIFFGMSGGIVKLAFSAQGVLFATAMSISGYQTGADVQSVGAIWGIRFLIGLTPIIASLIIVYCMYHYPLGRPKGDTPLEIEQLSTL